MPCLYNDKSPGEARSPARSLPATVTSDGPTQYGSYTPFEDTPFTTTPEIRVDDISIDRGPASSHASDDAGLAESAARRTLELRLLHYYMTYTSQSMPGTHDASIKDVMSNAIIPVALDSQHLLYAILATTIQHIQHLQSKARRAASTSTSTPSSTTSAINTTSPLPTWIDTIPANQYELYLGQSIALQAQAVANISKHNADAVVMNSVFLHLTHLFDIPNRSGGGRRVDYAAQSFDPLDEDTYTPPGEYLRVSYSHGTIVGTAWRRLLDPTSQQSCAMRMVNGRPWMRDVSVLHDPQNRTEFNYLLDPVYDASGALAQGDDSATFSTSLETLVAYEDALSFIGFCLAGIRSGEEPLATCRRLTAFGPLRHRVFVEMVEEGRPRALCVLACWFALFKDVEGSVWWAEGLADREVRGIWRGLPVEWRGCVKWAVGRLNKDPDER